MKKKININPPADGQKGFTLVEMLAVVIVFSIIGGIISAIFVSSLRGSNKANVTNEVRQNGNYALLQMSKMISYAKSFDGISVTGNDDDYVENCYTEPVGLDVPTPTPIDYHYLKISSFDRGQTTFVCNIGDSPSIASKTASLTSSLINTETVKVDSCKFSCSQSSRAEPPTIGIIFALSQKNGGSFFEHKASISFDTTVVMRN